MLDELQLLKEIVGDLSGVGMYMMLAYVCMRIIIVFAWVYTGKHVISGILSIFKADITKQEARELDDRNHNLKREMADVRAEAKREVEEVKHLYKILKESSDNES